MPKNWTSPKGLQATGRRVVRRATASSWALPDFLVLGAQKAGTTSLGVFLHAHPDVFWTPRPELHFFDRDYDRGLSWYRSWFARRSAIEAHERQTGRPARVGEKTPSYVVLPDGPTRVAAALPGVKLVVSLRDPVSRAYSQWSMNMRTGRETLSFADALEAEPERLAAVDLRASVSGTPYLEHGYAMRSRYAEQLERWLAHFERSQLYVYRSEDLYRGSATVDPAPARPRGGSLRRGGAGHAPRRHERSRSHRSPPAGPARRAVRGGRRPAPGPDRPVVLPGSGLGGPPLR